MGAPSPKKRKPTPHRRRRRWGDPWTRSEIRHGWGEKSMPVGMYLLTGPITGHFGGAVPVPTPGEVAKLPQGWAHTTGMGSGTCDWGECNRMTEFIRWDPNLNIWLAVCARCAAKAYSEDSDQVAALAKLRELGVLG